MIARGPKRSRDGGYILVAVLSVMLLLTGILGAGSLLLRSALHSVRLADDDVTMAALEQGGLEITAYQLCILKAPPRLVDGRPVRLANATITPAIEDEGGKVDLNGSDPKLLQSLFASVGMEPQAASDAVAAIVAFRGPDAASPTPSPQTVSPQTQPPPQTVAKPRGFQSVDQLGSLPGMTRADVRALAPFVTVFNPTGKVDVLSARQEVLTAIPGVSRAEVAQILARRASDKGVAHDLQAMLTAASTFVKTDPGPAFTARLALVTRDGRRGQVEAVIAASKSPSAPYYVLEWRD